MLFKQLIHHLLTKSTMIYTNITLSFWAAHCGTNIDTIKPIIKVLKQFYYVLLACEQNPGPEKYTNICCSLFFLRFGFEVTSHRCYFMCITLQLLALFYKLPQHKI